MLRKLAKRFITTEPSKISKTVLDFIKERQSTKCFDNIFYSNSKLKLIMAPENSGTCLVEFKIDETTMNARQVIHGGAIASLIDIVSTIALVNTPLQKPGVSVDMNISFLKPAKLNESILVEGTVVKSGSKISFLKAEIYLKEEDSFDLIKKNLVATGTHTKFMV